MGILMHNTWKEQQKVAEEQKKRIPDKEIPFAEPDQDEGKEPKAKPVMRRKPTGRRVSK